MIIIIIPGHSKEGEDNEESDEESHDDESEWSGAVEHIHESTCK